MPQCLPVEAHGRLCWPETSRTFGSSTDKNTLLFWLDLSVINREKKVDGFIFALIASSLWKKLRINCHLLISNVIILHSALQKYAHSFILGCVIKGLQLLNKGTICTASQKHAAADVLTMRR